MSDGRADSLLAGVGLGWAFGWLTAWLLAVGVGDPPTCPEPVAKVDTVTVPWSGEVMGVTCYVEGTRDGGRDDNGS